MAYVDLAELKSVLGIGNIYADSVVQAVADSAENVIKPYLLHNRYSIISHQLTNNVAFIYCDQPVDCYVGQSVVISDVGTVFNGTKTITELIPNGFKYAKTNADIPKHNVVPYGWATFDTQIDYSTVPEVREASMAIAVDIWMQRMGTTGQQGVDFAPQPYKIGRAMLQRVIGLLGPHIDPKGLVG